MGLTTTERATLATHSNEDLKQKCQKPYLCMRTRDLPKVENKPCVLTSDLTSKDTSFRGIVNSSAHMSASIVSKPTLLKNQIFDLASVASSRPEFPAPSSTMGSTVGQALKSPAESGKFVS